MFSMIAMESDSVWNSGIEASVIALIGYTVVALIAFVMIKRRTKSLHSSKSYNSQIADVLDDKKNLHLGQNDQDFDIFNKKIHKIIE